MQIKACKRQIAIPLSSRVKGNFYARFRTRGEQWQHSPRLFYKALAFQKERLNANQSCMLYGGLTKELTQWKKQEDLVFLKQVHSQPLQQSLKNLSQAVKEAFDQTNPKQFPRFKKKGNQDSFRYPQGFKIDNINGRVFLPKIGWIRYHKSQDVIGDAKNVTLSKKGQHWFVSIQVEISTDIPLLSLSEN